MKEASKYIILHSVDMTITDVHLLNGNEHITGRFWQDTRFDFLIFESATLPALVQNSTRDFVMVIEFNGEIKEALSGLYRTSYQRKPLLGTTI